MASESFKKAIKILSQRQQNAKLSATIRYNEVCEKIPRIKEICILLSQTSLKLSKMVFSENSNVDDVVGKIINENMQLQRELNSLLIQNEYGTDYLEPKYHCKACEDSGYISGIKCSCLKELVTQLNVASFGQSTNITPTNFQQFSTLYYSDINDSRTNVSPRKIMSEILEFCVIYSKKFNKNSPSVLMIGETGLGKTHLSLAIADVVIHNGYVALYTSALDLFRTLQNEYFGKGEPDKNTMQTVLEADLVIIDDLGAEFESQFNTSSLYNIINSRLNANRPTIINTNLVPSEIERRYSSRVASRLMTLYKCLKFVGKDVRQIKLKNNEI